MRTLLALLFLLFSISNNAQSQDICIPNKLAQISSVMPGDSKKSVITKLGKPDSITIDYDKGSSGQNSGEVLYYNGLDIFIANIGGVSYIKASKAKYKSVYGIKVGMSYEKVSKLLGATDKNKIIIYLCNQSDIVDTHFIFNFNTKNGNTLEYVEIQQSEL